MPSLADERAFYDLMGWARTASDETFVFSADPGPMNSNTISIHDDDEADSLWTWHWQAQRSGAALPRAHRDRWLEYFRGGAYRNALPTSSGDQNPPTAADPKCHTYGWGWSRTECSTPTPPRSPSLRPLPTSPWPRSRTAASRRRAWALRVGAAGAARPAILVAYLAEATGKAKWVGWRNALIDLYLQSPDWQEAPTNGIVQGGAYFCDRPRMSANGQNAGYTGTTRISYSDGDVAYNNGARSNTSNPLERSAAGCHRRGPAGGGQRGLDVRRTHREHFGDSTDRFFAFNKGQLQYCYQLFENGGRPALL